MEVISGRMGSSLNPYAEPFVPVAYRTVEDFSEEWWDLVKSSPVFRDYWLRECFEDEAEQQPETDPDFSDIYDPVLPDSDSLFHSYPPQQEEEEDKRRKMEMIAWGAEKWNGRRGASDGWKLFEKAPKIVNVRVSPRTIQQPR